MSAIAEAPTLEAPAGPSSDAPESTPLSEAMAELASLDSPEPEQPRAKAPAKSVEEPKKPAKAVETKAKETPKETPKTEPEPKTNAELRAVYEKTKKTLAEREAEYSKYKQEVETKAKAIPAEDPEKKSLLEKITGYEKRIKELSDKEMLLDYQSSEEFQTKYWKPYQGAVNRAIADLEDVTYTDKDGNPQKVDSNMILWLAGQKPAQAEQVASQLFGEAGLNRLVTDRIDRIRNAADEMNEARAEHQKSAEERMRDQQAKTLEMRTKITKIWTDENNSWQERFPNWFKPKDGDDQGNALLVKGYELVDKAFSPNGNKLSPEERAKVHAEIRNKAAAFPRMALRLKQARERIAELEKNLADYEKSEPPAGDRHREAAGKEADPYQDAMSELDSLK